MVVVVKVVGFFLFVNESFFRTAITRSRALRSCLADGGFIFGARIRIRGGGSFKTLLILLNKIALVRNPFSQF